MDSGIQMGGGIINGVLGSFLAVNEGGSGVDRRYGDNDILHVVINFLSIIQEYACDFLRPRFLFCSEENA